MHDKTLRGASAAACALALSACASLPAERHAAAPAHDRALEAEAQAFESFVDKASAIRPDFSGPGEVATGLTAGAAYTPRELEAGMIAYAALAARADPKFAAGVRAAARRDPGLARRLQARPELARSLPGASAAAARASAALARQGEALRAGGKQVKSASYSLQRQAWAKAMVADPRGRLERVKALGGGAKGPQLFKAVAVREAGGASPVVRQGVALAALSVLGRTDRTLLAEPRSGMCLRLAKLNFHQCLASAGPYYEDIYCLGQHAMIDPGACVSDAAR